MMSVRFLDSLLLLSVFSILIASSIQDDLTTDYAKRIIRQSKVAEMKGMLDSRVAPCDDFYSYACGNWHRQNPAQLFRNIITDNFQIISKEPGSRGAGELHDLCSSQKLQLNALSSACYHFHISTA